MTALLTDEEISQSAWRWGRDQPSTHLPDLVVGFENGARFARSIYEARLAELAVRKFLDQPSDLKGIQHEHNCAAFHIDERTGYFSGLPCDCGAQVRWCDLASARLAEAISLMKEAAPAIDTISSGLSERFDRFLAIYTKEDKP